MGTGSSNTNPSTVSHGEQVDNTIGAAWENRNRFGDSPSTVTDSSNYFLRSDNADTSNTMSRYVTNNAGLSRDTQTNNGDNTIFTPWGNHNRFLDSPSTGSSCSNIFSRDDSADSVGRYITNADELSRGDLTRNSFDIQQLLNTVVGDATNHGSQSSTHPSYHHSVTMNEKPHPVTVIHSS